MFSRKWQASEPYIATISAEEQAVPTNDGFELTNYDDTDYLSLSKIATDAEKTAYEALHGKEGLSWKQRRNLVKKAIFPFLEKIDEIIVTRGYNKVISDTLCVVVMEEII